MKGFWRGRGLGVIVEALVHAPSRTPEIEAVIVRTLESLPPEATHWSSRGMSRACGLSVSTGYRPGIWRA